MNIPARPITGKAIPQGWHGQLWDWVQSMSVSGDKKTIFVKETTLGKCLSGKPFSQEQNGNSSGGESGTLIKWAKVTALTGNCNSYICEIYVTRANSPADETAKAVKVWDIMDTLAVNDWIPVQASIVDGFDYECIQQIGLL
jgi:hypothetical protein